MHKLCQIDKLTGRAPKQIVPKKKKKKKKRQVSVQIMMMTILILKGVAPTPGPTAVYEVFAMVK